MKPAVRQGRVYPDSESLYAGTAEWLASTCAEAIARGGRFTLALSGGSTPRSLYRLLAGESWCGRFDWKHIEIFQVDERVVPIDDPESNFGMLQGELLKAVPILEGSVHRMRTELGAEAAAEEYEGELRRSFGLQPRAPTAGAPPASAAVPAFDAVLLGMGADGHTASLFPGTAALRETRRLVLGYRVEKLNAYRITLTLPVLNHARKVLFLVAGAGKAATLREVFEAEDAESRFPAAMVNPPAGALCWHLDREAASLLRAGGSQ